MDRLLHRVLGAVARYGMFSTGQKVGVAVSGGADSVCLLFVLRELAPRLGIALSVLHLDHGLRGAESAGDAEFVRGLAARLSLPVVVEQAGLRHRPGSSAGNLEQAARHARLEFFSRAIASGAAHRVALGHTRSDQAETVLFRLLRGAAGPGLAGIRPVTAQGLVRPLIEVDRAAVEDFLRRRGIPWREDSTNRSLEFARNRIRHSLLPQLAREWNPAIAETLARTADWALEEESWWESEIDRLSPLFHRDPSGALRLRVQDLAALPPAVARRLARRALELVKGDLRGIDFTHVTGMLALAAPGLGHGHLHAPGLEIVRSFDWLRLSPARSHPAPRPYALPVAVPGVVQVPGSSTVILLELSDKKEAAAESGGVYNKKMSWIDWSRIAGPLELRNWRPGDRYQPLGRAGEQKIKQLFQVARIPLWERSGWPVLADRTGIVWTRHFGPAAALTPRPEAAAILRIRETAKSESETPAGASIALG